MTDANKESKELTREERVAIATRIYGLYMMPIFLSDAKLNASSGALVDIDCAMDNAGVPYYRSMLKDSEKAVLEEEKKMLETIEASKKAESKPSFTTRMYIEDGRVVMAHLFARKNDNVWAVALDADGEPVLIHAYDTLANSFGFATKEVRRFKELPWRKDIDKFLSDFWMYTPEKAEEIDHFICLLMVQAQKEHPVNYQLPRSL